MVFKNSLTITVFLFIFCCLNGYSQNTGFGGNRFVLKANVINGVKGFLTGGSVEYVLSDKWTLTGGINGYSVTEEVNYSRVFGFEDDGCLFDKEVDESTEVTYRSFYIDAKYYFSSLKPNFVNAPKGYFFSFGGESGLINMDGHYHMGIYYKNRNDRNFQDDCPEGDFHEVPYEYNNINYYAIKPGFGYQYFITPWLTASGHITMNMAFLKTDTDFTKDVVDGVKYDIKSNVIEGTWSGFGLGLSANLEVGVMLF